MRPFKFSVPYGQAAEALSKPLSFSGPFFSGFSGPLSNSAPAPTVLTVTGLKINDVKMIREQTGMSLQDAKLFVEKIYDAQDKKKHAELDADIAALFGKFAARYTGADIRSRIAAYDGVNS